MYRQREEDRLDTRHRIYPRAPPSPAVSPLPLPPSSYPSCRPAWLRGTFSDHLPTYSPGGVAVRGSSVTFDDATGWGWDGVDRAKGVRTGMRHNLASQSC